MDNLNLANIKMVPAPSIGAQWRYKIMHMNHDSGTIDFIGYFNGSEGGEHPLRQRPLRHWAIRRNLCRQYLEKLHREGASEEEINDWEDMAIIADETWDHAIGIPIMANDDPIRLLQDQALYEEDMMSDDETVRPY
jgi:hypothetical protein